MRTRSTTRHSCHCSLAPEPLSQAQIVRFLGARAQKVKVLHAEFVDAIRLDNVAIIGAGNMLKRTPWRGISGILGPVGEVVCGYGRDTVRFKPGSKLKR
jgi:hypothetical protein